MPYVNRRWLGGLLTNFNTIRKRIQRLHELRELKEGGRLDLLPTKERMSMEAELRKLEYNLGGVADMERLPGRGGHHRPEDRGDRAARGRAPRDPDHRAGGHQLRPEPGQLRNPRQRRRDPLLRADHRHARRIDRGRGCQVARRRRRAAVPRRRSGSAARRRSASAARPRRRPSRRPRRRPRQKQRPRPRPRRTPRRRRRPKQTEATREAAEEMPQPQPEGEARRRTTRQGGPGRGQP